MLVGGPDEWAAIWPQLARLQSEVLVQELMLGPEAAVESYHAYADARARRPGEFAARKIRTFPRRYGFSAAVEVVELPDVAGLGHEVLSSVGLMGVAQGRLQAPRARPLAMRRVSQA